MSLLRSIEELLELKKSSGSRSRKQSLTAVGTRCADHATPLYPQKKLALTSPTGGGRSVGIVRSRTKATEFYITIIGNTLIKILILQVLINSYITYINVMLCITSALTKLPTSVFMLLLLYLFLPDDDSFQPQNV